MIEAAVKGWCPGARRPMESGDGLIIRLKLTGGIVDLDLATRISNWSRRFGNGEIDLTARANLQIRGVRDATLPSLQDAIAETGLLDDNPDGEAIRNVIASPLAGIDPAAVLDIRPVVAALEARLVGDSGLYALPAKFCFAIDDGGSVGLRGVRADVLFEAIAGSAFAVRLDGAPEDWFGPFRPDEVPDVATRLAGTFLARRDDARRIRYVVERIGATAIANDAGFTGALLAPPPLRGRSATRSIDGWGGGGGTHPDLRSDLPLKGGSADLSVGLPFGRISSANLKYLADQAAAVCATELRLTPWRAIFIPCPSPGAAERLAGTLLPDAFIIDTADPRRRVAACVGAPACPRATTDVRADAGRMAPLVPKTSFLHLSGCAKGCAHPRLAPVTLVGNNGCYDLIRDGAPSDSPLVKGLTLDEAASYLREMAAMQTQGQAS